MAITKQVLADSLALVAVAARLHEQALNAADAKLGDGDTGGMLARVVGRMAEEDLHASTDIGSALVTLGRAATAATGSSLGTLLATALLSIGRATKGQEAIEVSALADLLAAARDAMIARGGASLGDKTVLDSLDAIIAALKSDSANPAVTAAAATQQALDDFQDKPNRVGRARMFGDSSIGIDDPGMLAFALLTKAIVTKD